MDSGLWEKLQRMAAAGERVVVVEGGEAFVLLPLAEYERVKSGEASLQRLPGFGAPAGVLTPPAESKTPEAGRAGVWLAPKFDPDKEDRFTVDDVELGQAGDEAEEEERFYLEPVE